MKQLLLKDIAPIIAGSAYVLILLKLGSLGYNEIQYVIWRLLNDPRVLVPVGGAIESMAYMIGALIVGLISMRRGFVYGASVPVLVQILFYVWYVIMGHNNVPAALVGQYHYPFYLYIITALAWIIQSGVAGIAGVAIARRSKTINRSKFYKLSLAAALLAPQVAAWCYMTHAIMWSRDAFPLQIIEFIITSLAIASIGYGSIYGVIKAAITSQQNA